jgi:hypothetical protein
MDEMNMEELSVDMDAEFAKDEAAFNEAIRQLSGGDGLAASETLALYEKLETLAKQGHAGARARLDAIPDGEREKINRIIEKAAELSNRRKEQKKANIVQAAVYTAIGAALLIFVLVKLPLFSQIDLLINGGLEERFSGLVVILGGFIAAVAFGVIALLFWFLTSIVGNFTLYSNCGKYFYPGHTAICLSVLAVLSTLAITLLYTG